MKDGMKTDLADLTDEERDRLRQLVRDGTAAVLDLWNVSRQIESITRATYTDLTGVFEEFAVGAPPDMSTLDTETVDMMVDAVLNADAEEDTDRTDGGRRLRT